MRGVSLHAPKQKMSSHQNPVVKCFHPDNQQCVHFGIISNMAMPFLVTVDAMHIHREKGRPRIKFKCNPVLMMMEVLHIKNILEIQWHENLDP